VISLAAHGACGPIFATGLEQLAGVQLRRVTVQNECFNPAAFSAKRCFNARRRSFMASSGNLRELISSVPCSVHRNVKKCCVPDQQAEIPCPWLANLIICRAPGLTPMQVHRYRYLGAKQN
jgi:hypothetical protein